jgi:hypothetical protein
VIVGVGAATGVVETTMVVDVEGEDVEEEEAVVIVVNIELETDVGVSIEAVAGTIGMGLLTEADEAEDMEAIGQG